VILTSSLRWKREGFGRGILKGFVERSIPWLTRALANTDLGFQLQTHGIHQPIAIGGIVNTEGKGD
jgi:hypothetical protein